MQVERWGVLVVSCIRNNVKVDIVPFEKMEKQDFQLNQKELSANSWVIAANVTGAFKFPFILMARALSTPHLSTST